VYITISIFTSYPVKIREAERDRINYKDKSLIYLGFLLFFYMTMEAGIAGWIVEYYRTVLMESEALSLFSLSLFFILITAGRLVSSFYADRIGLDNTLLLNMAAAMGCLIIGTLFRQAAILIPCSGFFLATAFPSTVALLSKVLKTGNIRILGAFFSIGGLGGLAGPWLIGAFARQAGLDRAYLLLIPFSLCGVLSIYLFKRNYHERTDIQPAAL
ncbi:MAG: MFS transporter, partial [Spirochaetales bacterium]|nr:MFS transporter [Spirochaetales bacterium]